MLLATDMSTQIYPSILLWDTNINELNQILDFMYFGEVKVSLMVTGGHSNGWEGQGEFICHGRSF